MDTSNHNSSLNKKERETDVLDIVKCTSVSTVFRPTKGTYKFNIFTIYFDSLTKRRMSPHAFAIKSVRYTYSNIKLATLTFN